MSQTRILLVEDERIIAKGIEKSLKTMGYTVAGSAATGEDALRMAIDLRPDIILMDINLGSGMDGVATAAAIRSQLNIPIVFLTAHSDDATLHRAKLTEPHGYVLKPYEDRNLQTAIEIGLYRHKAEKRLRENEQWLAATLGSIGDGVIATDESGAVRFMNTLAERLTGWQLADAVGKHVVQVFHIVEAKTRQPVANPVLEALATGRNASLASNTVLLTPAGDEYPIDDSAAPIRDSNGTVSGAVLVFRDITERRRLEEHLRQAQKMEAIGRLAGGIAHDFNNIMTVIIGTGELLLNDLVESTAQPEMVQQIVSAGERAAALTKQIMAFSRKQMLVPSVLNLNTVVRDIGVMVKRLIGSNIEFVTQLAPDLGQVKADPSQVGQVILNLAANARDAMPKPEGGQLVIGTANATLDESVTRDHPDVKPGRYVCLAIGDNGSGIPADVLPHIFEPFYTTKGVGHGTGLGLATVYGIVKQTGGHVEVVSRVGEGTTFRIYLPLIEAAASLIARDTRPAVKGSETILLVEDDDSVRLMTKTLLQQNGYTVLEATNGTEGIQFAEKYAGQIHLLMTDLVMPQLGGRHVAQQVTAMRPGIKVLFTSGYTEDVIVRQGVEADTVNFISKPFSLIALTNKVREVLDRE